MPDGEPHKQQLQQQPPLLTVLHQPHALNDMELEHLDSHVGEGELVDNTLKVDTLLQEDILKEDMQVVGMLMADSLQVVGMLLVDMQVVGMPFADSLHVVDILLMGMTQVEEDTGVLMDSLLYVKTDLSHWTRQNHACHFHCSCWFDSIGNCNRAF